MTATTNASGEKSGGPMAATTREISPPAAGSLIQELTGVWKDGATSWSLENLGCSRVARETVRKHAHLALRRGAGYRPDGQ